MYGFESVMMPKALLSRLNMFQLKGLRKILRMKTTFIDRSNTNQRVFEAANTAMTPEATPGKNIKSFSEYVSIEQCSLLTHTVREPCLDPLKQCTLDPQFDMPITMDNRRVGRPRQNWAWTCYETLFTKHRYGTHADFANNRCGSIGRMLADIRAKSI